MFSMSSTKRLTRRTKTQVTVVTSTPRMPGVVNSLFSRPSPLAFSTAHSQRNQPMPKRKNNPDKHKDTRALIVSDDLRKKFTNTAKPITDERREYLKNLYRDDNFYGFDMVPKFLQLWGRLFQAVVSQAGTKMLTGKYHTGECGIYKYEGGCKIYGVGE